MLDPASNVDPGGYGNKCAWLNVHLTKPFQGNGTVTVAPRNNVYFNANPGASQFEQLAGCF